MRSQNLSTSILLLCCLAVVYAHVVSDDARYVAIVRRQTTDEGYRVGVPTETNSCQYVREVPQVLRDEGGMKPEPVSEFYQKYTEAYGLPVLSSINVEDDALRRFCYTLRFLLADNNLVRDKVYNYFGHFVVLGVDETPLDLPEFSYLDEEDYGSNRGLFGGVFNPIALAGEDNALCSLDDSRRTHDVVMHEMGHALHLIGAEKAIPGYEERVDKAWKEAMDKGLWKDTYSATNAHEYFATGVQLYFYTCNYNNPPDGTYGPITTRERLMVYDPALYELMWEIFPCNNQYLERCQSTREMEDAQNLMMNCNVGGYKYSYCHDLMESGSCQSEPDYMEETCPNVCAQEGLEPNLKEDCEYWALIGECTSNAGYMQQYCATSCGRVYYPETANKHSSCRGWANAGYCDSSSEFADYMAMNCAESCADPNPTDKDSSCPQWAEAGECVSNPVYMMVICPESCEEATTSIIVDDASLCRYWADETVECLSDYDYMNDECQQSCYDRTVSGNLVDGDPSCETYEDLEDLCTDKTYMIEDCEKTCMDVLYSDVIEETEVDCTARLERDECTDLQMIVDCPTFCYELEDPVLEDLIPECPTIAAEGKCSTFDVYATVTCPESCPLV